MHSWNPMLAGARGHCMASARLEQHALQLLLTSRQRPFKSGEVRGFLVGLSLSSAAAAASISCCCSSSTERPLLVGSMSSSSCSRRQRRRH
jgi:hypothetical protein